MLSTMRQLLGRVTLANFLPDGTKVDEVDLKPNLVTVQGTEILARLLAGDIAYKIAGVYFEFQNDPSPTSTSYDRTTTAADFWALSSPRDYIRAGLVSNPTLETGDSSSSGLPYSNNRAVFFTMTAAVIGENGLTFSAASDSYITSCGLVAMPQSLDPTLDLLYARFTPASPFAKVAGRNPGLTWTAEML